MGNSLQLWSCKDKSNPNLLVCVTLEYLVALSLFWQVCSWLENPKGPDLLSSHSSCLFNSPHKWHKWLLALLSHRSDLWHCGTRIEALMCASASACSASMRCHATGHFTHFMWMVWMTWWPDTAGKAKASLLKSWQRQAEPAKQPMDMLHLNFWQCLACLTKGPAWYGSRCPIRGRWSHVSYCSWSWTVEFCPAQRHKPFDH